MMGPQLSKLVEPFASEFIATKPGRGNPEYVEHSVVTQRLLEVLGPFSFEVRDVVQTSPCQVLASLTVEIDGRTVTVTEAGQSDNDSDLIKSAVSDALKRCAMRLGVGLHLWAGGHYYLADTEADRLRARALRWAGDDEQRRGQVVEWLSGFGAKHVEDLSDDELGAFAEQVSAWEAAA